MGRDKAFVEVHGVAMVRRVADALVDAGCHPVAAVGGDPTRLAGVGLDVVPDDHPGDGPIGAIITALRWRCPVLVVACDLPLLGPDDVGLLLSSVEVEGPVDVVVATTDHLEPLCAIWMPSALEPLVAAFGDGERAAHRVIATLRARRVPMPAERFLNVNAPGDLPTS